MSRRLASGLALLGMLAALGCASPPPAPARLRVDVLSGFERRLEAYVAGPERVELIVDLGTSMLAPTPAGPGRYEAAKLAAARLVSRLPAQSSVRLHALAASETSLCAPARVITTTAPRASRAPLIEAIDALAPGASSSLALTTERLRKRRRPGAIARTRLVVMTDLESECEEDLCGTFERWVESGGRAELVLFGDAEPPACLATFESPLPAIATLPAIAEPPRFHVEAHPPGPDGAPRVVGQGTAGGKPIAIQAGAVEVVIEVEPPVRIGGVLLSPGATTHLRVLNFPALEPRVREWSWDTLPASIERRATRDAPSGAGAAPR